MDNLKIDYVATDSLQPYERNTRKHGDDDVHTIAQSISKYGFNDPIGVWGTDNLIVEGHGRLLAAQELGLETVPIIHLDHMTDEQRREYAIAHNRTAELSEWDLDFLDMELEDLSFDDIDLGLDDIGAEEPEEMPDDLDDTETAEDVYAVTVKFSTFKDYQNAEHAISEIAEKHNGTMSVNKS